MATSQSNEPSDREYVDDRDLARRTPISRSQWQTWRREGGGPPWSKIGRRCIYKWSDCAAFIEAQCTVTRATGTVRITARQWVDAAPEEFSTIGAIAGSKVMVAVLGTDYPGRVVANGSQLAILLDGEVDGIVRAASFRLRGVKS